MDGTCPALRRTEDGVAGYLPAEDELLPLEPLDPDAEPLPVLTTVVLAFEFAFELLLLLVLQLLLVETLEL